jgi:formiminotetrahydrofolate cyclodeaminase
MDLKNTSCEGFLDALASSEPVPGGGGASALAGALAAALGSMVANITIANPKCAPVKEEVGVLLKLAEKARGELAGLVAKDAAGFLGVVEVMKMPRGTDAEKAARDQAMEKALSKSAEAPFDMVRACVAVLGCLQQLMEKGAKGVLSDVGTAAALCGAALQGAAINVYANTKYMKDREAAEALNRQTGSLVRAGTAAARGLVEATEELLK